MLTLRRGRVTAVVERVDGLSRIEVDGVLWFTLDEAILIAHKPG